MAANRPRAILIGDAEVHGPHGVVGRTAPRPGKTCDADSGVATEQRSGARSHLAGAPLRDGTDGCECFLGDAEHPVLDFIYIGDRSAAQN